MKRIDDWVARNLDPTEMGIIARDGLDVCEVTWNLVSNSKQVCKTYEDHAVHIWMMLDDKAEQYSLRPLQILDEYGMKQEGWPCSHEGFAQVAILWAIEQVCKEKCPDWANSTFMANRLRGAA